MLARPRALALVLLLAGCDAVPRMHFPQVEQAGEAMHDSGERYRVHHTCTDGARSADELLTCMHDAGWDFIQPGPEYPKPVCWEARDQGDLDRLAPFCFVRSTEHQTGVVPTPPAADR